MEYRREQLDVSFAMYMTSPTCSSTFSKPFSLFSAMMNLSILQAKIDIIKLAASIPKCQHQHIDVDIFFIPHRGHFGSNNFGVAPHRGTDCIDLSS